MYFFQSTQSPVQVTLPSGIHSIPKLTLRQMGAWAAIIADERYEEELKDLPPVQRSEFMRIYPKMPPTIRDLRVLASTTAGIEWIIRNTFKSADPAVSGKDVATMLESNGIGSFERLAWELADFEDSSRKAPPSDMPGEESDENPTKKQDAID